MSCGLSRDAQILWKKPLNPIWADDPRLENMRAVHTSEEFEQYFAWRIIHHCSSCDHEWTGESDCPMCGGEAF